MIAKRVHYHTIIFLFSLTLVGCVEMKTSDAEQAYKYWTDNLPNQDVQLLNGQYWQSSHWTKEYIVFLKMKVSNEWWKQFLKQNLISKDKDKWVLPANSPTWFSPSIQSVRYGGGDDFDQGSRYFRDSVSQISYIYEIQL